MPGARERTAEGSKPVKALGCLIVLAGTMLQASAAEVSTIDARLQAFSGTWRVKPVAGAASTPAYVPGRGPPPYLLALLPRVKPEVAARFRPPPMAPQGQPIVDTREYCVPASFNGATGYVVTPAILLSVGFEILPSPGRLTLLDEMGLVRRIYLADKAPANSLDQTHSGTSLARFEGSTLVVQTTGLNPKARVLVGFPGSELGQGARIEERFTPEGRDGLQITSTVTAPALYREPVSTTNHFVREPGGTLIEMSVCVETDRAIDHANAREQFDITPPADLPPPPSN
jgi:hypothetical protein